MSARLAGLALLVAAALAPAASGQVAARLDDLRLATAVRLALVADVRTRTLDVSVAARDGGVEVAGAVGPSDRRTVDEVARAVPGVRVVGGAAVAGGREPARPTTVISPRPAADVAPRSAGREPAGTGGAAYHTVERGDTLFSLARRYDTSVAAIQALNGRESAAIQIGQRLRVR